MALYTIRQRDLKNGAEKLLTSILRDPNRAMIDKLVAILNAQDDGRIFQYESVEIEQREPIER